MRIRTCLPHAAKAETKNTSLTFFIDARLPFLTGAAGTLASENKLDLIKFLSCYVAYSIEFTDILSKKTRFFGHDLSLDRILTIAEQLFVLDLSVNKDHGDAQLALTMNQLLYDAYLVHRILEELNDQLISLYKFPFSPCDASGANALVHTLIGQRYASEIETVVAQTLDYVEKHQLFGSKNENIDVIYRKTVPYLWPCMATQLGLSLH